MFAKKNTPKRNAPNSNDSYAILYPICINKYHQSYEHLFRKGLFTKPFSGYYMLRYPKKYQEHFSGNTSETLPNTIHPHVRRIIHHEQVGLQYRNTRLIGYLKIKFIMRTK